MVEMPSTVVALAAAGAVGGGRGGGDDGGGGGSGGGGEYQSDSPQPEDFYMVQTAEWAKGFALRKAEELIEWTKTHGLKREL